MEHEEGIQVRDAAPGIFPGLSADERADRIRTGQIRKILQHSDIRQKIDRSGDQRLRAGGNQGAVKKTQKGLFFMHIIWYYGIKSYLIHFWRYVMQLKIEYLSKNDLKPYVNNAKIHTDGQVEQIRKSIEEFDFNDPIAVWGENEIVEGHGRLLAAMEMDNLDTVPVIRLDHLTDKQRKAYALAHNKLTMNTGFDASVLEIELADIGDIDMEQFGFEKVAEFDEGTLDELFEDAPQKEKEPKKIQCPHCGEWFEV